MLCRLALGNIKNRRTMEQHTRETKDNVDDDDVRRNGNEMEKCVIEINEWMVNTQIKAQITSVHSSDL